MTVDKFLISSTQPSRTDIAWAKPVKGGFALYLYINGIWQPQVVMNSEGSLNPDDDQPYDLDHIGGNPGPDTVGTEQIIDGAVEMQDLHDDVKNKIQKDYYQDDEALHMDYNIVDLDI